jgi:hypothetical protein
VVSCRSASVNIKSIVKEGSGFDSPGCASLVETEVFKLIVVIAFLPAWSIYLDAELPLF